LDDEGGSYANKDGDVEPKADTSESDEQKQGANWFVIAMD